MTKKKRYSTIGRTGLTRFGGDILEETRQELRGRRGMELYQKMSQTDAVIGAIMWVISQLTRRVRWWFEPASTSKEDVKYAEFAADCLHDMDHTWNDVLAEMLDALVYGWSWCELVYKVREEDNRIGWDKWLPIGQTSLYQWEYDTRGNLVALTQQAPPDFIPRTIPRDKSLHFKLHAPKHNPEGKSILQNAYYSWYVRSNLEQIEAIGIERDLVGLPILWLPPHILQQITDADKAAYTAYEDLITNLRRDEQEGLMMPLERDVDGNKLYDIALLSGEQGGASGAKVKVSEVIQRHDIRICMTVMADWLLIGHQQSSGSYNLVVEKGRLFSQALTTVLDSIAAEVNHRAVKQLWEYNAFPLASIPVLTHDDVDDANLGVLSQYILALSNAGLDFTGDEDLENRLRDLAELPHRTVPLPEVPDEPDKPKPNPKPNPTTEA